MLQNANSFDDVKTLADEFVVAVGNAAGAQG
jgi:hypothetical protein